MGDTLTLYVHYKKGAEMGKHVLICRISFPPLQVLVLRELAISVPTFFFQQVQPFFDNIFVAVWDPKQAIREGAVSALRACLILTTQRESKEMQKPQWYRVSRESLQLCYKWPGNVTQVIGFPNQDRLGCF